MYETIKSINDVLNGFIWGVPAMVCIIGVGLYLSIRTGFVQVRKFPYALKNTIGKKIANCHELNCITVSLSLSRTCYYNRFA